MFQTKVLEKIKFKLIKFDNFFFGPQNGAVYEIIWKNMVESYRLQMTILYGTYTLHAG